MIRALVMFGLGVSAFGQTMSAPTASAKAWPTQDGVYSIANFRFGSGESLPELKLHYLTLGRLHRDAAGMRITWCCCFTGRAEVRVRC